MNLISIVGASATLLSALTHPSHLAYLWRHRDDTETLKGVSMASAGVVVASQMIWVVYGLTVNGIWAAAIAGISVVVQTYIVVVVSRAGAASKSSVAAICAAALAALITSLLLPGPVLGAIGVAVSAAMWVPAAIVVVRAAGTAAGRAYPPVMSTVIVVANLLWLVYGLLLNDIWLWLPCPLHIASGMLMLWAYAKSPAEKTNRPVTV